MAKLSAHGEELGRVELERTPTREGALTCWTRITYAVMEDGVILKKLDVRFKADANGHGGGFHSYGWKKHGKLRFATTKPNIPELARKWIAAMVERGYHEVDQFEQGMRS